MNTHTDREIERRLAENAARYTSGRQMVVQKLAAVDGPRTAAELHAELGPRVPLSSLYRTLSVLEEAGVVVPHFGVKGLARYELAEWLTGHHHHLVCTDCGAVDDVDVPQSYEATVRELVEAIGSMASFDPTSHTLEIEGLCARCTT